MIIFRDSSKIREKYPAGIILREKDSPGEQFP